MFYIELDNGPSGPKHVADIRKHLGYPISVYTIRYNEHSTRSNFCAYGL